MVYRSNLQEKRGKVNLDQFLEDLDGTVVAGDRRRLGKLVGFYQNVGYSKLVSIKMSGTLSF